MREEEREREREREREGGNLSGTLDAVGAARAFSLFVIRKMGKLMGQRAEAGGGRFCLI